MTTASTTCRWCSGPWQVGDVRVVWAPSERTHIVTWRLPSGQRRKARVQGHRAAGEVAADVRQQLAAGAPQRPASITVPELVQRWIDDQAVPRGWSAGYIATLAKRLDRLPAALNVPLEAWTAGATEDALALAGGVSIQRQTLSMLRQAARWGRRRNLLHHDPTADLTVAAPARTTPHTDDGAGRWVPVAARPDREAVERLAAAMPTWREALAVRVSAYCGLRWAELAALEGVDLGLGGGTLDVARQVDATRTADARGTVLTADGSRPRYWHTAYGCAALPKGDKTRQTLLPAHLAADLAALGEERDGGLLWPARRGGYWTHSNWTRDLMTPARQTAGWPKNAAGRWVWSWHSLRHHAATWMLEDLALLPHQVAALLGHTDAAVTHRMYVTAGEDVASVAAAASAHWARHSS